MSLDDLDGDSDDDEIADIIDDARPTDPRKARVRFSSLKLIKCPEKYRHAAVTVSVAGT